MSVEKIQKTTLPNGIRVVSEYVDFVHSAALGVWIIAGSQNETKETNGIAHLLEHMAFKGTTNRTAFQIAHTIESLGGILNAFTSKDLTCYYVRLMAEYLDTGVDVLSDLILNPYFKSKELEREKGVIIEEIKDIEDSPADVIHDYFAQEIYPDHPLGRPIQGTIENVKLIGVNQLKDFIKTYYTSDRLVVVASGKVKHEYLVELTNKYLGDINAGNGEIAIPDLVPIKEYRKVYSRPISQSHIMLGRRIFPQSDYRRYHLALLNVVLSGGMSSRLFHNIREKYGFVYAIYSFADFYSNEGLFRFYAGVDSQRMEKVKSMIYKELEKLATDPISEQELKKVKQQFKGGLVLSLENMLARMSRLAKIEIFEEKLLTTDELLRIIESISSKDLQNLASYLYDKDVFIETIIKPQDEAM
ncbi:MAG: hypothetical protein DRP89_04745 [Candidatus Neomarinimicrobiota bacterium]|nr:MAG: hypothetical protein DRP89_04745 [Candidatus Neomarinimicrobiota bacterium]